MIPEALVYMANVGRPRRPSGMRYPVILPYPLADVDSANRALGHLVKNPFTEADLPIMRSLQQTVAEIAEALVSGHTPFPLESLNAMAMDVVGHLRLYSGEDNRLYASMVWHDNTSSAQLLVRILNELSQLDPRRFRTCARPECGMFFYDHTRSGTRLWHAESPCGWRERQRRRKRDQSQ